MASIDYKNLEGVNYAYIHDGSEIGHDTREYISYVVSLNVGEIYLNSRKGWNRIWL